MSMQRKNQATPPSAGGGPSVGNGGGSRSPGAAPRGNAFAASRVASTGGKAYEAGPGAFGTASQDMWEEFPLVGMRPMDWEIDETVHDDAGDVSVQNAGRKFEISQIAAGVARARVLLRNAAGALPGLLDPAARAAFEKHFHTTEAEAVAHVAADLARLQGMMGLPLTFEVEHEEDSEDIGYVYRLWSDIHLTQSWFQLIDDDDRAATIIHECSHKFCGTGDHAYHWQGGYKELSPKKALDNADSYSTFCVDVS